jgi:exopolysaccharide production protein ExoQ
MIVSYSETKSASFAVSRRGSRLIADLGWIVFFFAASGGVRIIPIENPERYFWAPLDAIVAYLFVRQSHLFLGILAKNITLVSWAVLATLSGAWSLAPGLSIYQGLQLFMTILAGVLLCLYTDLAGIMRLVFIGLLLTGLASVIVCSAGVSGTVGINGEWVGVFPHKNVLGMFMTLLVVTGLCLAAMGWRSALGLGGAAIGTMLLVLSRSGAALLSLFVCSSIFLVAMAGRYNNRAFAAVAGVGLALAAAFLFVAISGEFDLASRILEALGKDSTLTGRTTVWDFGLEQFWRSPVIGVGFRAYWESTETSAKALEAVLKQRLPHFHNNFLDVAVGLGAVGLLLFLAGLGTVVSRVLGRHLTRPTMENLWPVLFVAHTLATCSVEAPIFLNHHLFQALLVVASSARERFADRPQRRGLS